MKIAINKSHKGKHPPNTPDGWWSAYNGQFTNVDLPVSELARAISQGYGYTTQHKGYRKAANFICGQHIGLDFDTEDERSTIEALMADPFIDRYSAIIHTTASHTPEKPRGRVLFILDRPIARADKYTLLATALLDKFGQADQGTKDACRLFFGAEACAIVSRDIVLTLEAAAEEIVKPYKSTISPAKKSPGYRMVPDRNGVPGALLKSHSEALLERIRSAPDGQKWKKLRDISRTFGGYISGGYYDSNEARVWLREAIESRRATVANMTGAYKTIDEALEYGQLSPLYFDADRIPENSKLDQTLVITPDTSWRGKALETAGD